VELFAAAHPDVLFTDIELPGGMSGTDLADAVRELDPNIKVLFTTSYAREAVLHERWLEEKVPWLLKPYSHLDLARELRALIGSHGELSDRRSFQRYGKVSLHRYVGSSSSPCAHRPRQGQPIPICVVGTYGPATTANPAGRWR
jgi:DNA-binding LytR/AlgR family response regulator